jgi:hypothetical protein
VQGKRILYNNTNGSIVFTRCNRFSDRPDIKENPAWHAGEKYAERARAMIIKAVDEPSIANLQGLTLLTVHEYGCGRLPRLV